MKTRDEMSRVRAAGATLTQRGLRIDSSAAKRLGAKCNITPSLLGHFLDLPAFQPYQNPFKTGSLKGRGNALKYQECKDTFRICLDDLSGTDHLSSSQQNGRTSTQDGSSRIENVTSRRYCMTLRPKTRRGWLGRRVRPHDEVLTKV